MTTLDGAHAWSPVATSSKHGLGEAELEIAAAIIRATLPAVAPLPGGDERTVARLRKFFDELPQPAVRGYAALLWSVEAASVASHGRRFRSLDRVRAEAFLDRWAMGDNKLARTLMRAVLTPIKYAHFDARELFEKAGCGYGVTPPTVDEQPRWLAQVSRGVDLAEASERGGSEPIELEAEVVVIGTGAGGAAMAYELARRGRAVLMLEEGEYHRRSAFTGNASAMSRKLYRDHGMTIAYGNVGIPVWAGRAVGGTTLINSGTCYRAPERVFARWRERYGLAGFSSDSMDSYYTEVEAMLQVTPAAREHLGGAARVVERGARKLGLLHHGPLRRNAPDCDGQGVCCFGCPTGAKRSTDVSYVPRALERGAQLITGARVDRVEIVAGRARGVRGFFK
ncbi:MAG: GMC family oxidoreductase N-terminal domain-containing protein, partial [Polyangiales bacterium]